MKFRLIPAIVIGLTLAIVTSKIVYFAYTPKYGPFIFSKEAFHSMFDHDVFKYRVLSQYMLFALDDWMSHHAPGKKTENNSSQFYHALFYLNTFFLCLTSILIVLLLRLNHIFKLTHAEKYMLLYLSILIINFSQFVVSPYDISSYFFQLLILYLFLFFIDKDYYLTLVSISSLIFLSTLNRESAALSVSLLGLLLFLKAGISKKSILALIFISGSFLATYITLRSIIIDPLDIHFQFENAGNLLAEVNIMGLFFWIVFFCLTIGIASSRENRWVITIFHLACAPYIIACFQSGVLWEVRLYTPLFLSSIYLSKLNPDYVKTHLTCLFSPNRLVKHTQNIIPGTKITA